MRAMKDSGVEWIGEIPEGWEVRKLIGLLKFIGSGTTPKGEEYYSDGNYKWLNTGDLNDSNVINIPKTINANALLDYSVLRQYPAYSIVIAMYGATVGKLGILSEACVTNQACCVMYARDDLLENKFLFYFLFAVRNSIISLTYGAGQPNISQETVKKMFVPVCGLDLQRRIVSYLDGKCAQIDTIIEKQQQVIEKLKAYKQSVITESVTKGLDPTVPMKDSGVEWIGEIATSSYQYRLKHLVRKPLQYGANESGIEYSDDMVRYVRITDITPEGTLKDEGKLSLSLDIAQEYLLDEGDILFARSGGTVGKTMLYHSAYGTCAFAGYLIRASAGSKILPDYLYYFTKSSVYESWKNGIFIQATIQNIGADKFSNMILPVPSIENQKCIVQHLDMRCLNVDTLILSKQSVIDKLTAYKKSLIYEVVTGKMEV